MRNRVITLTVAAVAALGIAGMSLAAAGAATGAPASGSSAGTVFRGCLSHKGAHAGIITHVQTASKPKCPKGSSLVSWNQKGQKGDTGPAGKTGPAGPAGPEGPAQTESSRLCTPVLCIDDAPGTSGNNGSGGWGWDTAANGPVTSMKVGDTNPLTVTELQGASQAADGSMTLTWNVDDFKLVTSKLPSDGTCAVGAAALSQISGGYLTCSFTDLAHTAKSALFYFTAVGANPAAAVNVTVQAGPPVTSTATARFPIRITG